MPIFIRRRLGFTLAELLVILVILGILTALVMPPLAKAREKRRRIACASNLRQIGIAIMAYAGDNTQHIPSKGGPYPELCWDMKLVSGGYITENRFACPSDNPFRVGFPPSCTHGTPRPFIRSYGIAAGDVNVGSFCHWISGSSLTCTALSNSTEIVLVTECANETSYVGGYGGPCIFFFTSPWDINPNAKATSFHSTNSWTCNYLFLDGHVAWMESNQLTKAMFPPAPNGCTAANPACP